MPTHQQFSGRVLVVDDDEDIRAIFESALTEAGFWITTTGTMQGVKDALNQRFYNAVLLDIFLGEEDGLEVVPHILQKSPYTKIFIMSAAGTVELAVSAMQKGATSFICKTKDAKKIISELKKGISPLRPVEQLILNGMDHGIIGRSPTIQRVMNQIEQIKNVDSSILIAGESGTGKELVARAIHNSSNRSERAFSAINCGAIPENLLESELFGYKRGAFTDAKTDRKGIFEVCSDGTLFLDEICEMPLELQVKLLRVLQEKEVKPIGSSKTIKIDTRIVSATNRNPLDEIKVGRFREDLYYRLSVITIDLPPLRERKSDIDPLIQFFLEKMNTRFLKNVDPPNQELMARLVAYSWPGNVRELQNSIERGIILSRDDQLHFEDMFQTLEMRSNDSSFDMTFSGEIFTRPLTNAKRDFEKEYLKQLLEMTRGSITEMARISHRYRADIYRLLIKHGLEWEEFRSNYPTRMIGL